MTSHQPPPHDGDDDRTRHLDAVDPEARERAPLEATVEHEQRAAGYGRPGDTAVGPTGRTYEQDPYGERRPYGADEEGEERPPRRWGKGFALVLLGLVLGIIIAFVVIALGTDSSPTAGPSDAAMERIDELEAEVGERDARIADLEAQLAEADAGEADEAIAAQREALDDRAAELDSRAAALDDRDEAIAEREQAVEQREQTVEERERALDEGEEPPPDDDGDGVDLPELEDEEVEGFIEDILDRIRDLF